MNTEVIYHTDELLRKHHLLVKQKGWGDKAAMSVVDWQTLGPASEARVSAWHSEAFPEDGACESTS